MESANILIVEDELISAMDIQKSLEKSGFNIVDSVTIFKGNNLLGEKHHSINRSKV